MYSRRKGCIIQPSSLCLKVKTGAAIGKEGDQKEQYWSLRVALGTMEEHFESLLCEEERRLGRPLEGLGKDFGRGREPCPLDNAGLLNRITFYVGRRLTSPISRSSAAISSPLSFSAVGEPPRAEWGEDDGAGAGPLGGLVAG